MPFPEALHFHGDMRVTRYNPDEGLVMNRAPEPRGKLLFGLAFSVGLILVGAWLFWGKAYEHYGAGRFSFVDWLLFAAGLAFVTFGAVVAIPLAARLFPRRLQTRHAAPALALKGVFTERVWTPSDVKVLRILGRRFVKHVAPESAQAHYTYTLELISSRGERRTRLLQTGPLPERGAGYSEMYPVARYLADIMDSPFEYRDNWETDESIIAPTPAAL